MTLENAQKLYEAFPHLYRGRDKFLQESLLSYGFACGDGWFDLIWHLSCQIEALATHDGIDPYSESWPEAVQVKEKLGTLRFHLRNRTRATAAPIEQALEDSEKICEHCGVPGTLARGRYGMQTLCVVHVEHDLRK